MIEAGCFRAASSYSVTVAETESVSLDVIIAEQTCLIQSKLNFLYLSLSLFLSIWKFIIIDIYLDLNWCGCTAWCDRCCNAACVCTVHLSLWVRLHRGHLPLVLFIFTTAVHADAAQAIVNYTVGCHHSCKWKTLNAGVLLSRRMCIQRGNVGYKRTLEFA